MSQKAIIIGGGAAGLAASVALASKGFHVEVFEARHFLGGRIFSFVEPVTKDLVDNGQHIFTGFYYETFKFLSLIGSSEHITRQKRLSTDFISKKEKPSQFVCPRLPAPFHLLWGFFNYSNFPKRDLYNIIRNRKEMKREIKGLSASDFLDNLKQSNKAERFFYRPLVLATLNAELNEVSGRLFQRMLNTIFSVPASHSVLAYSTIGFSELISYPAADLITRSGGEIHYSTPIKKICEAGGKIEKVIDHLGREHTADIYIVAVTPRALSKMIPEGSVPHLKKWSCSPIVSVNIWYDRPVMDKMVVNLLDGSFDWCFDKSSIIKEKNKHRYVTLLSSSAYDKIALTKKDIIEGAINDMNVYFPSARSAKVLHVQVIKERNATVLISPEMERLRPGAATSFPNLFLAGDWIDTGLPATVESAVKSGFTAAELASV